MSSSAPVQKKGILTVVTIGLVVGCVLVPLHLYTMLFGSEPQRFVCERHSGRCELNGDQITIVDELKDAGLGTDRTPRSGRGKKVELVLHNGSRFFLDTPGAHSERSIAEYRAAAQAIRAFIADRAQPRLDVTFVYRASLSEKIWAVIAFAVLLLATLFMVALTRALWRRASRSA